ncbi:dephospho-CoA kinase [Ruania zhangjianzhongii]|uniref:dephospho-CoA kinase n=1 Tax=Ruania zhangjianzhongii TaxID=2603206 RepID=UPI0011C7D835|nr:dephospho-CoA kinase [Ruania zhangjianzhongii]
MLHIGLTGGIGAGKSTVAAALIECGAHLIDADQISRDVLEPGTAGLAAVIEEFGPGILSADSSLDRPALARTVFGDDEALRRLNAVVHPLVRAETKARLADLPASAVVIHDVPLIVENELAPEYHLVLVVGASAATRTARLQRDRGMSVEQIRARMTAQADDAARARVADVWIDNDGARERAVAEVAALWRERIAPYAGNIAAQRGAERPERPELAAPPDPPRTWAVQAEAVLDRLRRAGGDLVRSADHIGSTAVPGLAAKDVLDLQIGVTDLAAADQLAGAFARAGFPRLDGHWYDSPKDGLAGPGTAWDKRFHANADPGRAVNLHVRVAGGPGWRYALLCRDWLRADDDARSRYQRLKQELAATTASTQEYAAAKEPWFDQTWPQIRAWAERTGWAPPPF